MKIRLAIIDDDQKLAAALRSELINYPDIGSIVTSSSGLKYARSIDSQTVPDVVLMDISMGFPDEGIQATRLLHERFTEVKVIMFTVAEDDNNVFEAFKSGALGYLLKNESPDFIHKTIVDVFNGGALMSPGIALKTIRHLTSRPVEKAPELTDKFDLTGRELDILKLVTKGYTYQSVADQLFISHETVKKHMSNVFKKLQVQNKIEALNKAKSYLG